MLLSLEGTPTLFWHVLSARRAGQERFSSFCPPYPWPAGWNKRNRVPSANGGMVLEKEKKKHHERVHVVAVVLMDCFDASLDMWKWEEGVHTHGKYICIFTIECTREVHGLSSWQGVCLNKCQRAQKLVLRAEDKMCKAEMCVYMYVCLCVQERY